MTLFIIVCHVYLSGRHVARKSPSFPRSSPTGGARLKSPFLASVAAERRRGKDVILKVLCGRRKVLQKVFYVIKRRQIFIKCLCPPQVLFFSLGRNILCIPKWFLICLWREKHPRPPLSYISSTLKNSFMLQISWGVQDFLKKKSYFLLCITFLLEKLLKWHFVMFQNITHLQH